MMRVKDEERKEMRDLRRTFYFRAKEKKIHNSLGYHSSLGAFRCL